VLLNVADRYFKPVHVKIVLLWRSNEANVIVGNVTLRGERRWRSGVWQGNVREEDDFEDLGVDGRKILQFILKK